MFLTTLAAFQQGTNEALEAMVANHQELITGLKVRDNNIKGALARRDEKVLSAFAGLCND